MPSSPDPSHLSSHPCLFDTHAHLTDRAFDHDREAVINRALEQGVVHILCVGYDLTTSRSALDLARRYQELHAAVGPTESSNVVPLQIWTSVGVHPHDADSWTEKNLEDLKTLARDPKVKAIGETGIDFYRNYSKPENQRRAFTHQIRLAQELNLPLIIHIRNGHGEALNILKAENYFSGVMHCFSGDQPFAREALDLGFFISFSGSITFNGKELTSIIKTAPVDRLLAETDCPYLAPQPERGKRNEPRFVGLVVEAMARARGMASVELAQVTCENGKRCFRIS